MKYGLILAVVASPAFAREFTMPAGCEAYLTIQASDCSVSHHFTCEGDPAGEQRRADLDEEGLSYVGRINAEAEWLESFHLRSAHTERLSGSADPMSMSELIANGVDTWDFETDSDEIGPSRYVGMDRLSGETVTIDGIELLVTNYELIAYDALGNIVWEASGQEHINPDWRMFVSGVSTYETSGDTFTTDGSPVEFIFPGEPGYLSVNPKHGCGAVLSLYEVLQ